VSFRGFKVLALVPARGGSKGLPGKNLKPIRGMSLVARAARTIAETGFVDRAVCSTDDPATADEAKSSGLAVPELRPAALATDTAKSIDVWRHVWLDIERRDSVTYDLSILVEPTSPLRRAADLERTLSTLVGTGARAAATVSPTPAHFTPHKTLTIEADKRIGFFLEGGSRFSRRQDIPAFFHRNGVCYAARRDTIIEHGTIVEDDCIAVVIERPLVNIDEPLDLEVAELLAAREAW
jgi:CMP-N,N'-diacetyllegionaminic acid synthase